MLARFSFAKVSRDTGGSNPPRSATQSEVKAVVQPADINEAGPALEAELIGFCRAHLSAIKCRGQLISMRSCRAIRPASSISG